MCACFVYLHNFYPVLFASQKEPSLTASNQQIWLAQVNNFRKGKTLGKVKFDISELFFQCNKDSCYELITVGVNIYFYGCVSLLGPDSAVCLCICVYMCVCVCVRSNQSTSKKTHYVSDLSKLVVCTRFPLF